MIRDDEIADSSDAVTSEVTSTVTAADAGTSEATSAVTAADAGTFEITSDVTLEVTSGAAEALAADDDWRVRRKPNMVAVVAGAELSGKLTPPEPKRPTSFCPGLRIRSRATERFARSSVGNSRRLVAEALNMLFAKYGKGRVAR
jgi:hypothetical protein